jgi:hypothetical protein
MEVPVRLGIFAPTLSGGWVISTAAPHWKPDWYLMQETARKAEYYDFDFLLAPNKYKGMDGEIDFWNYALDSFTTMAALAAVTNKVMLIPSISLLSVPPVYAANRRGRPVRGQHHQWLGEAGVGLDGALARRRVLRLPLRLRRRVHDGHA